MTPAGCGEAYCDVDTCRVRSVDADDDGHRRADCTAVDSTAGAVITGDDCNDNDGDTYPGAWDGPGDATHPDRCDAINQDCDADADDDALQDGTTCACTPGDTIACSETAGGQAIDYPALDGTGHPLGQCRLGSRTCAPDGQYGACIGAVPPDPTEYCNGGEDDDCDGNADMADTDTPPEGRIEWTYDEDGDGYAADTPLTAMSCPDSVPATCATCNVAWWSPTNNLIEGDCDDTNKNINPSAVEICNQRDDDCNGVEDDNATNAKLWYFDYDGDNYGDVNVAAIRSCLAPPDLPAGCATMDQNLPVDYCDGVPGEATPSCPVVPCDASMWKQNLSNTDCMDRPDQVGAGVQRGNNPVNVHQGASDLCNDRDYDCDGTANTGCACSPVDATRSCGAQSTCNLGTQTCTSAGWGACSGGPEKLKVTYCRDDDSDTYCELSSCVPGLCPGSPPVDGHTYIQSTSCTGYSFGQTDCADGNASVHPGNLTELCNGDGLDYDCNGNTNLVGEGDCGCVNATTQACASVGQTYPGGVAPGDPLQGLCSWGTRTCTTGTWDACAGGQGMQNAQGSELCNGDGSDHNCNGISNLPGAGDCGCSGSETRSCGTCGLGTQACNSGQWGLCTGDVSQVEYCQDGDSDTWCGSQAGQYYCPATVVPGWRNCTTCVGSEECDGDANRNPGRPETCGDGLDANCNSPNFEDSDGFNLGAPCNVASGQGACANGGTIECTSTSASACSSSGLPTTACSTTAAPNGSFDWDCNQIHTYCSGPCFDGSQCGEAWTPGNSCLPWDHDSLQPAIGALPGTDLASVNTFCQQYASAGECFDRSRFITCSVEISTNCSGGSCNPLVSNCKVICPSPCGSQLRTFFCAWDAGQSKCLASDGPNVHCVRGAGGQCLPNTQTYAVDWTLGCH